MPFAVTTTPLAETAADVLAVGLFEGSRPEGALAALDRALDGEIAHLLETGDVTGKSGQTAVIYGRGRIAATRLLVVGLGKGADFTVDRVRQAAARAAQRARDLGAAHLATTLFHPARGAGGRPAGLAEAAQATVEGILLGLHRLDRFKTNAEDREKAEKTARLAQVTLVAGEGEAPGEVSAGASVGEVVAGAVRFARELIATPSNEATPSRMAQYARDLAAEGGFTATILGLEELTALGAGGIVAVNRGSHEFEPARFGVLEYDGTGGAGAPVVLVGKGITFDTGGISLKPADGMDRMKYDKAGSVAVLATFKAVAALKLPVRLVGLCPWTENTPSGSAYRPGDVVRFLNGKTAEIVNTDAEGRVVLADALAYASRYRPAAVIDLATLTGAIKVALGTEAAGLMSNDPALAARVKAAAEASGERVWELPLFDEYRELIKSDIADIKNSGGRDAGSITAALFLKEFVDYPWVHLDIAGVGWADKDRPYVPKGAVGFGVRLLVQFLRDWARDGGR
ncbi:MAG TPA: leucyl aminopeptidase [Thermodesulfobacteriota bacterium]